MICMYMYLPTIYLHVYSLYQPNSDHRIIIQYITCKYKYINSFARAILVA